MTVETSTSRSGPYAGAGTTGPFTVGFRFLDATHLQVIRTDSTGDHTLVLNTDYTVAGVGAPTGSVTLTAVLPVGQTLTIIRNVPITQEADYVQNDDFPAESHETALDKLTMIAQQIAEATVRSIMLSPTASGVSTELPLPEANKAIGWNSTATALRNIDLSLPAGLADLAVSQLYGQFGDSLFRSNITRIVDNIAALRALDKTRFNRAYTAGYYAVGDSGGGAAYYFDAADTTSVDNGGSIIVATDGGRWKMIAGISIRAEQFGAVGDGVTDSTTAILNAKNSLTAGGILWFGTGTFIIGTDAALTLNSVPVTLKGIRGQTVLKAKDGALLTSWVALAVSGCSVEDLILDGNRANNGTQEGFYNLYLMASDLTVRHCVSQHSNFAGAFVGSGTETPRNILIQHSKFLNNGGTVNNTGDGVGIYGGGAFPVDGLVIDQCTFEENYNTVPGFPGDSTAMNIIGTNITVTKCIIKNNHNVQGGQIALTSNGVDGSVNGRFIVIGNQIIHTIAVAGENTTGIEIEGREFVVANNIVRSLNGDGIRLETSGGDGIVMGNSINCTATGINLITTGGTGVRRVLAIGNQIKAGATVGISVQAGAEVADVCLLSNFIAGGIATKIAGAADCYMVRGNINYAPPTSTNVSAGASPYNFPKLPYDAMYTCEVLNGISGILVDGTAVSILQRIPIFVPAQETITVSWAGSAPQFNINAAQGG